MDATHIHLVLTHFPIVGSLLGIGVLIYGLAINNDQVKIVALSIFILMSLLTIPVFLSGEGAEETVEHISGVSENLIEVHEELAEKAIWLMGILGVVSLIGIISILRKASFAKPVSLIVLILSLATFGLFAKVGNLGGQIRHSEIRTTNTQVPSDESDQINYRHDDDDDDD